ncbi:MAG TPA: hypothetical protein VMT35_05585 [Ignavibacteriaceae bacterium]|nr:hypothetical protein [Ignavibacteriaceae bacterium]
MKNILVCKNCQTENPFYQLICTKCKSFLRERVFNIDLWKVLSLLIESPLKGFQTIIYAEHKNFLALILLLASGKFAVDLIFFSVLKSGSSFIHFLPAFISVVLILSLIIFLFSFLIFYLGRFSGTETRIIDNFSILIYSLAPHVFALIILFPVEVVIFGEYLFSGNPSPFIMKPGIAYTLLVFELLIILWGLFLTASAIYAQFRNVLISIAGSVIITSAIFSFFYFLSR